MLIAPSPWKIVRICIPEWTLFASDAHLLVTRLCPQIVLFWGLPSLKETGKVWTAMDSGRFSRQDCQTRLVSVSTSRWPDGSSSQKVARVFAEEQPLWAPSEAFSLCLGVATPPPLRSALQSSLLHLVCDQTTARELERGLCNSQGVPTRYFKGRRKVSCVGRWGLWSATKI